jgi:hypothetical protein
MANISYECATTLFIGFLPSNKKPVYYTVLLVYEKKIIFRTKSFCFETYVYS